MSATTPLNAGNTQNKPISLLSLDAGGPQGVSQLLILKDVMKKLGYNENGDSEGVVMRPCEVFDVIGGVGSGGLIAIFLAVLKMTVEEALDEFTDFAIDVFKNVDQNPQKQTQKLERATHGILWRHGINKDSKLIASSQGAPTCRLVVPIMYKSNVGVPCVLRNYVVGHEPPIDLTIAEAMLATCASPPAFTPKIILKDAVTFEYVSGDLGLSNPTREVLSEAHRAFGDERTVDCLLSIGCGHLGIKSVPSDSSATTWINFLTRVMMNSEKTAHDIASHMSHLTLYHRLSVNRGLEADCLQEWKDPESVTGYTTAYLDNMEVVELVDRCVDAMKQKDGFTTLEQLTHLGGAKVLPPPLPPLASNYVERKLPMEMITKALFEKQDRIKPGSKRIIVTGIGGCGKTQLIRDLIEKYRHLFESIFFVDGSSPETIRRDIVRHVRALGGPHSQKSFEESMALLSQALHDGQRLLVIDNVDDPTLDLAPFLPRWESGAVIVTSRDHSRGQLNPATHLQLDVMTVEESVELLLRGSGKHLLSKETDIKLARVVAEELGCHPIALVQAISYMYNTGCSPGSYVDLLRSGRDRLLGDHPATSQVDMRYKTAFAAFDASYSILPHKAQQLWHLLSFFRCQNFPVELVTLAAQEQFCTDSWKFLPRGDEFQVGKGCLEEIFYRSGRWDPLELHSILATLRGHSLIASVSTETVTLLQMHPLVHEWGRLRIPEKQVHRFESAAIRLLCCGATEDNYSMMQHFSGHVEGLSPLWKSLHANDASSLSFILSQSGIYDKAATLEVIAYEKVKHVLGPNDLCTVNASVNLAVAYNHLGLHNEALELEIEVLRRRRDLLGVDHPDTIRASSYLAVTYHDLGRYIEAEKLQKEVLQQQKQLLGEDHLDTIRASEHLASTYHALGRYAEAERLNAEIATKRKQILGADHPDTIRAREHLASAFHALERYAEAEELKREVLFQRRRSLGNEHPDTLSASEELAATLYRQGNFVVAEELQLEVLGARTRILGERHPETIQTMLQLARTYKRTKRRPEATALAQKALQIAFETQGDSHPLYRKISTFFAFIPRQDSA